MTRRGAWLAGAVAAALAVVVPRAALAFGDKVEAGSCSIASAGSASNNTVTCNFGLTSEQLKQVTEAAVTGAVKGATGPLVDRITDISKTLGVTEDAAKTLLKIVGEDPNIPEDKLAQALTKVASDYKRLQAQAAALNPDNPTAKALVDKAKSEIVAGHLQHAHQLLRQATQAQIAAAQEASKLEEQAKAATDAQMLGAASSTAVEAGVSLTERDYLQTANLYGQAADDVPTGHSSEHGGYLGSQAYAFYRQGDERGDNAALRSAREVSRRALADYPRSQFPLDWAAIQNYLGNALKALGERENGTATLEEAVAAYRAALEEWTRERVPFNWAMTENNLGAALQALGEREGGTARLEEAVAAYRASLEECTRERVPFNWAMTENNLGAALEALGEREGRTAGLEEAVAAYRLALEELTRERVPLDRAMTENNLGAALRALGERETGTARLEEAVAADRLALEELTRERVPLKWSTAQTNLGAALEALGERESGTGRLEEAVAAYRAALEERTRERVPLDWAASYGGEGVAMVLIADRTNDGSTADAALRQIEAAYKTARLGEDEQLSAELQAAADQGSGHPRPAQGPMIAVVAPGGYGHGCAAIQLGFFTKQGFNPISSFFIAGVEHALPDHRGFRLDFSGRIVCRPFCAA